MLSIRQMAQKVTPNSVENRIRPGDPKSQRTKNYYETQNRQSDVTHTHSTLDPVGGH